MAGERRGSGVTPTGPESREVERFADALRCHGLLDQPKRVLVGVSGGTDSSALLYLCAQLRSCLPRSAPEFFVGHVHHGLRGAEADRDESFVRGLASKLRMVFLSVRVSARELAAEAGLSVEEAGRTLRFRSFRSWAEEHRLHAVLLGHQREDQQETVLLRVARGTGFRGLSGIPEARMLEGGGRPVLVVRPLLGWSRAELEEVLARRGVEACLDSTNASPCHARNVVRARLLPLVESEVHPGARRALERLAGLSRGLSADLAVLAERAWADSRLDVGRAGGGVVLDPAVLKLWTATVAREVCVLAAGRVAAQPPFSFRVWRLLWRLISGPSNVGSVDLGRGVRAELRYGRLVFDDKRPSAQPPRGDTALEVNGSGVACGDWILKADERPWTGPRGDHLEEWVDAGRVQGDLRVRTRRPGDVFHPLGAPGRQKLKEFFRAQRIDPVSRDGVPLVVSGTDIVWVVGCRLSHPYRVTDATQATIRLCASRRR